MSLLRRVGSWSLVLGCLGTAACGGSAPKPELAAPVAVPAAAGPPAAGTWAGPRMRVAVGQFGELEAAKALLEQMGMKGVGPLITEQITTGLVATQRVTVLERSQIGKVIGNTQLEKEGDLSKYFDQGSTAESGRLLGAQAMLVGAVTQFEPNVEGGGGGLNLPGLGTLKYHQDKAVVGIEVRLVEQQTGKVLAAAHGTGEVLSKEAGGALSYAGIGTQIGAYQKTPLGTATRMAAERALASLSKAVETVPWEGGVADVRGPEKVFIDAGEDLSLRAGQRFRVVHRGAPIQAPDGSVMGYDDTEAGVVEITQVQPKMSVARVVEGEGPRKAGDRVRFLPPR